MSETESTVDFESLSFKAGTIFTPSTPVNNKDLFSGRDYQLNRVIDLIFTDGQHGIIYGERGVGKTSLANILHAVLEPKSPAIRNTFARVNCDGADNFSTVWIKAMENIKFLVKRPGLGFNAQDQEQVTSLADSLKSKETLRVEDIRNIGEISGLRFIFIFDEFDRIGGENTTTLFADTIKMLSDYALHITVILIGVADNVAKLIKEHESIDRSLVQILMPRMSPQEIEGIINSALKEMGMTIDLDAKTEIINLSQGLPHYTHLVGLASFRKALKSKKLNVNLHDVREGIKDAIRDAQQTTVQEYNVAVFSPKKDTLFKKVLLAAALCQVDDLGYFSPSDVKTQLEKLLGHEVKFSSFMRHLSDFGSDKRRKTLTRFGEKRRYRFRFKNPLLQPYIIMKGIEEGLYK